MTSWQYLYPNHRILGRCHCMKRVHIRNYSGPYFIRFGLKTERCYISLCIQSEWGKIWTRITPNTVNFYAVYLFQNADFDLKENKCIRLEIIPFFPNFWNPCISKTKMANVSPDQDGFDFSIINIFQMVWELELVILK